jgi:hypothetical protein
MKFYVIPSSDSRADIGGETDRKTGGQTDRNIDREKDGRTGGRI